MSRLIVPDPNPKPIALTAVQAKQAFAFPKVRTAIKLSTNTALKYGDGPNDNLLFDDGENNFINYR